MSGTDVMIECVGWTLLHFLWEGLVIAIVLGILLRALRKTSANSRYMTGCVALALMIAAPVGTYMKLAKQPAPVSPTVFRTPIESVAVEATPRIISVQPAKVAVTEQKKPAVTLSWSERLTPLLPLLVAGWAMGVIVLALRLSAGWLRVKRLKRLGTESMEEMWHERLAKLTRRLRINRSVRLVKSALVEVPTVIGWLRPIILMPAGCLAGLSAAQVEYILAHELAHVRRHDYLVNLLQCLGETILFYHPAVWWVSKRIREEREHCCDDVAVSVCGDRLEYARTLAALEELRGSQNQLVMAAAGAPLLQRIRRLAGQSERNPSHPVWPVAAIIILTLVATLAIGLRNSRAVVDETQGTNLKKSHQATAIVKSDSQGQARAFAGQGRSTSPAPQINIQAKFFELDEKDFPKSIFNLPGASNAVSTSIKLTIPKHSSQVIANVTNSIVQSVTGNYQILANVTNLIVQSFTGILSEPDYQKALKAFKSAPSAELKSTPSVITEGGRSAQMFVGDAIPILTNNSPAAVALMPIGVMFDVTPTLLTNGTKLQLTTLATVTKRIDAPTTVTPPVEVAQLSMDATLEDRQTLVMGGFMPEVVTKTKDLFRSERASRSRKYLIVFVTPTFINADGTLYHSDKKDPAKASSTARLEALNKESGLTLTQDENGTLDVFYEPGKRDAAEDRLQETLKQLPLPNFTLRTNSVKTSSGRRQILATLAHTPANPADYDGLTLSDAVAKLNQATKSSDSAQGEITFLIQQPSQSQLPQGAIDPNTGLPLYAAAIVLDVPREETNASIAAILDCIATNNSLQYSIGDRDVVFDLKPPIMEKLFTRKFQVDAMKFQTAIEKTMGQTFDEARNGYWEEQRKAVGPGGIANMGGDPNRAVQKLILNFLSRSGVDLNTLKMKNVGKSFFFNDSKGIIMLHGSREDLDAMERILQKSDALLPQTQLEENTIKTDKTATQQAQLPVGVAKTNSVKAIKGRKEIIAALNRIHADSADYEGLTLWDAVKKMCQTTISKDPGYSGINFFIKREAPAQTPPQAGIDPSTGLPLSQTKDGDPGKTVLKPTREQIDVPLIAILDSIATNNSLQYTIEEYAVVFSFKDERAPMYTRIYHVNSDAILKAVESYANAIVLNPKEPLSTNFSLGDYKLQMALREFLSHSGLDFSPTNPANIGKSIFYKERKGILMVHSTSQDLDLIESVLGKLNPPRPYVQIKARFVEMDETAAAKINFAETMGGNRVKTNSIQTPVSVSTPVPLRKDTNYGSFPAVTNALAFQFTGVLTPEQYKEAITRLEKTDGVDILTTPDVTTESGRQAQIQAVDIQTVVTGLTTVYTNGTTSNMYSTQNLPFGPVLDVIPKVSADYFTIEMNLVANMTEFLGYDDPKKLKGQKRTDVQIPLPHFRLRQLTSSVAVWDGQTIVLGGVEATSTNKRGKGKQKTLIVFVTPTIRMADGNIQQAALKETK
jgi:beta-lactamase regulating signal transducer with metallopeptidase domain/type II secretory pathway component GspD/PulD (secretin)